MTSVEQIKSRLNIADVVQGYVKLQKAGVNFKANCPFHQEKTPSFFVSPARESWHCFGCSRGGDMFSFVMEIEGVGFLDSLKILGLKAGVEITPLDRKDKGEKEHLHELMDSAKKFFEARLKEDSRVIDYLKSRGVTGETAKKFGIGFAPLGWRNLHDFLKLKNYSGLEMEKAGLTIKSSGPQGSGYYDRFRNRIMFPITNSSGLTVGFSGRIVPWDAEAEKAGKYINSPQTVLFDKSKLLYGFDKAKTEMRKQDMCVLVEGQMDVVMSHQAGIENTVAVSGTALTHEQLNLIKRLTQNIVMAFDKDAAGIGAASRGIELAFENGFDIKIALVPLGKDPADTIKEDASKWKEAVLGAVHAIDFYLSVYQDRKSIEKNVLPYIAALPSEIEKSRWIKKVADKLEASEEAVWEEIKKIKKNSGSRAQAAGGRNIPTESHPKKTRRNLLMDRLKGFIIWQDKTEDKELKELFDKAKNDFNCKEEDFKESLALEAELLYSGSESLLTEAQAIIKEIEKDGIKEKLEETAKKIKKIELQKSDGEKEELNRLIGDFQTLMKKLNQL